jgi:hypothetical protein
MENPLSNEIVLINEVYSNFNGTVADQELIILMIVVMLK